MVKSKKSIAKTQRYPGGKSDQTDVDIVGLVELVILGLLEQGDLLRNTLELFFIGRGYGVPMSTIAEALHRLQDQGVIISKQIGDGELLGLAD